ncbi:MAG: FAD-dependent oxidoreductase [Hyphomicrobiaceae bacterium]|nr:FAD-dependent oxidoreductase [Hyphomicrobiaceae bacterium]
MNRIVIIGGGQSGAGAAIALRGHGFSGEITLVGREDLPPYERPALSKTYLAGDAALEKLVCLAPTQVAERNLRVLAGRECVAIDRVAGMVRLADGDSLAYDRLILATGGEARSFPGLEPDRDRVFVIRTVADADALRARLRASRSLLVIGGGWLGLETAATAIKLGLAVDVVEAADRLCARAAPPGLSAFLADLHRRNGVRLHLSAALAGLERGADGVVARLADGRTLAADAALVAVGLTPSTDLARAAGLAVDDGILTALDGRTSDPAIWAIGDCARYEHPFLARSVRLESWQNANQTADRAARSIQGLAPPVDDPPWFWSDQHGRNVQILGRTPDTAARLERGLPDAPLTLFLEDGRLVGMVGVDAARDIAMARKLVAETARLDPARAADPSTPLRNAVLR